MIQATEGDETSKAETDILMNERRQVDGPGIYKRSIYALPVTVQVVIGTGRLTIAELLKLQKNSLIQLDSKIEDSVDLVIDSRVIAKGELIETDPATGSIGIKVTEIVDISEDALT